MLGEFVIYCFVVQPAGRPVVGHLVGQAVAGIVDETGSSVVEGPFVGLQEAVVKGVGLLASSSVLSVCLLGIRVDTRPPLRLVGGIAGRRMHGPRVVSARRRRRGVALRGRCCLTAC